MQKKKKKPHFWVMKSKLDPIYWARVWQTQFGPNAPENG